MKLLRFMAVLLVGMTLALPVRAQSAGVPWEQLSAEQQKALATFRQLHNSDRPP